MMNKRTRKANPAPLKLARETISHLSDRQLKAVAGGLDYSGMSACWPCDPITTQ